MTRARSMVRLLAMLGIFGLGLASVAQAAGIDRKAAQKERENRVRAAVRARSIADVRTTRSSASHESSKISDQSLSGAQVQYVRRLVFATQNALSFEGGMIASENRLIRTQNRVIRQLNAAVNPNRILALENQGLALQASINQNLTFITAIQPAISATLMVLQPYEFVVPGIAAAYTRLSTSALTKDNRVAVIAARPPFTIPPATPAS
jgi:hypothetical protein